MKGRINNKLGEIQISSDVIAMYAGIYGSGSRYFRSEQPFHRLHI